MEEVSPQGKNNTPKSVPIDSRVNHEKPVAYAGPKQIVYEGDKVVLEGSCNLDGGKIANKNIMYSWNLDRDSSDGSRPDFFLEPVEENTRNASFIAPYVSFDPSRPDNQTYLSLVFKLVVKDINSRLESDPSWVTIIVKTIQRVLILQGGGALGAYEVGAYRALCERLSAKDKEKDARKNRPLFDIIAGTSIGALNAALIVNSIKAEYEG